MRRSWLQKSWNEKAFQESKDGSILRAINITYYFTSKRRKTEITTSRDAKEEFDLVQGLLILGDKSVFKLAQVKENYCKSSGAQYSGNCCIARYHWRLN